MASIQFHESGEWTAVYLDGALVLVGDTYLADEWLRSRSDVITVHDDAFMRGQSKREGVAKTLDEVWAYMTDRKARREKANDLRAEAQRLIAEAEHVEQGGETRG